MARNGQPAPGFRAGKVRSLFIYLSLEAAVAHNRATLATLFWPQQTEKQARQNLRQTLRRLRQALGDEQQASPCLLITEESIQWNPHSDSWLDVRQFMALTTAARTHCGPSVPTLCPTCLAQLEQAAVLYHGELLPGFTPDDSPEFEDWLTQWRERLHQYALAALHQLAEHHIAAQEWELARGYAQRQIGMEPWREEGHQQLMRVLAQTGQRRAALEQYGRCHAILAAELHMVPSAATEALRRQIEQNDQPTAAPPSPAIALPPLFGRETELHYLHQWLRQPTCSLLILLGSMGVGKSALARQLCATQSAPLRPVLWVAAQAVDTAEALWSALAHACGCPAQPTAVLAALSQHNGVIVLDNLDALPRRASLLATLLAHTPTSQWLVTTRHRPPLELPMAHLFRVRGLPTPTAESASAVQLFLHNAAQINPSAPVRQSNWPVVARICQLVGGNPWAIQQAAGWLRVFGVAEIAAELARNPSFLEPETAPLQAAFTAACHRLSPAAQTALADLRQLPHSFTRLAAEQVAALTPQMWLQLWDNSLLTQLPDGRYQIPPLYRLVAPRPPASPTAARRAAHFYAHLLHQQTAALRGGEQVAALATVQAELPNVQQAWAWAIGTAEADVVAQMNGGLFQFYALTGDFAAGMALFEPALAWPHWPVPLGGQLAVQQGWILHRAGQSAEGWPLLERGVHYLEAAESPALADALSYAAAVAHHLGHTAQAWAMAERSLALTQAYGDWWGAGLALATAAEMAHQMGQSGRARADAQQGFTLKRLVGDQWGSAVCLRILGDVAYTQRDYAEAQRCYQELWLVRQALQDVPQMAVCWHKLGLVATATADYGQARHCFEQSLHLYQQIERPVGQVQAQIQLGRVARVQMAPSHAQHHFHQALRTAVAAQLPHEALTVLQEVSHLWRELQQQQIPLPPLPASQQVGDYVVHLLLSQSLALLHAEPATAEAGLARLVASFWGG